MYIEFLLHGFFEFGSIFDLHGPTKMEYIIILR